MNVDIFGSALPIAIRGSIVKVTYHVGGPDDERNGLTNR